MNRDPSGKKIGVNDLCWCGSTKKYKYCHLDRSTNTPAHPADVVRQFEKSFSKKKSCSCPENEKQDCDGPIVKAHSVSRSSALLRIAEQGHVVSTNPNFRKRVLKNEYVEEAIGVNQASTFSGFCSYHDSSIFKEVDVLKIQWNVRSAFLLSYRTLCREIYVKKCLNDHLPHMKELDQGYSIEKQRAIQMGVFLSQINTEEAIEAGDRLKKKYDDILRSPNFDGFEYVNLWFDTGENIVGSGGFEPDTGLEGKNIQDLYSFSIDPELMTLNLLPSQGGTVVSIGWLSDERNICKTFVNDFINEKRFGSFLFMAFTNMENIFIRPSFWKNIPENRKDQIRKLVGCQEQPSRIRFPDEYEYLASYHSEKLENLISGSI